MYEFIHIFTFCAHIFVTVNTNFPIMLSGALKSSYSQPYVIAVMQGMCGAMLAYYTSHSSTKSTCVHMNIFILFYTIYHFL